MPREPSGYIRIDMIQELIGMDEESRTVQMRLTPDPRRYDVVQRNGERRWRDKFLDIEFGWDMLEKMMHTELPLFYSPPNINAADEYATRRSAALRRELAGSSYEPPAEVSDAHRPLPEDKEQIQATFISLDIANSTETRAKFQGLYDDMLAIMFREMATTVGHFHGTILKLTGDGFICYLDDPSINSQCDNSIDLGLTLLRILDAINDAAPEAYPKLVARIGAEHGRATVKAFGVPATGYRQTDVVSDALNRAAKIQESAPLNSLVIGRALYERIHVQWLERAREAEMNPRVGIDNYRTYLVR